MQNKTNIVPIKGLNKDDDPRYFEPGDYEDVANIQVGSSQEQGEKGQVTSIRSTSGITLPNPPDMSSYNYETLGESVDEENDRAYLLCYIEEDGPLTKFAIVKHDFTTDTTKFILYQDADTWNIKGWDSDMIKFHNPVIVDGKLIFTDNNNDIRMIDVDRMEATYDADIDAEVALWDFLTAYYDGYNVGTLLFYFDKVYEVIQDPVGNTDEPADLPAYYDEIANVVDVYLNPLDIDNFTLIAPPPDRPAHVSYSSDSSFSANHLKGETWQFTYQYVYMDYRKSVYASPSIIAPPSGEEDDEGVQGFDPTQNNRINVNVRTGNEEVRAIRVIARSSEDLSTWHQIKYIEVVTDQGDRKYNANSSLFVYFKNDNIESTISLDEVIKPFHYVPIKAKHMEIVEGNMLVFGNITEGYDTIPTDVVIDLAYEALGSISTQQINCPYFDASKYLLPHFYEWQMVFDMPAINPGACTFYVRVKYKEDLSFTEASYVYGGGGSYPSDPRAGIISAVNTAFASKETDTPVQTCFNPSSQRFCAFKRLSYYGDREHTPFAGYEFEWYYEKSSIETIDKYPNLKSGSVHGWGIIYRDLGGRITPPVGTSSMKKYIPFITEGQEVDDRPLVTFEINHLPPDQAVTYEIVYAGNQSVSWFLHLLGYNFAEGKEDHDDASSAGDGRNYRIRIEAAQDRTRDRLMNWSVEDYVWQKGDRIRIIGKVNDVGVVTEIADAIYDVEIVGVFTDTDNDNDIGEGTGGTPVQFDWIYFPQNSDLSTFTPASGANPNIYPDDLLVEIYRPQTVETGLFYTTGMVFDIGIDGNGHKYHKGDTDQVLTAGGDPSTAAEVDNTSHDSWKYIRLFRDITDSSIFTIWSESQYASDFYITQNLTSQGNPIPDLPNLKQNILTKRIRHGGKINIGSQLNQIAEFDYDDFLDLKDEHGPIEGLRIVGFVLKAVQHTKVVSIYINRLEAHKASGSPEYIFTDNVFGTSRPSMESWGTRHPDSVIVHNRHLYFWDQSEGLVIRDSANGLFPISDYKMKSYFKDLAETLEAAAESEVSASFEFYEPTMELFCIFGTTSSTNTLITFSEKDQKWKNIFDYRYYKDVIYRIGKRLFSTFQQNLYEWAAGSNHQSITGVNRAGKIVFYESEDPLKVKTYESIIVYQKGGIPKFNSVSIPEKATAGEEAMTTSIYSQNINKREGVYYCQILRDTNTPGAGTTNWKLLNGRKLRGLFCKVDLKLEATDPNDQIVLTNVIIVSTPSERSK